MKFGENMKTTTAKALKCRGGPLRDNLSDLPERKTLWREGLKHHGARIWKIIVEDPRQNHRGRRNLFAATPEGIS